MIISKIRNRCLCKHCKGLYTLCKGTLHLAGQLFSGKDRLSPADYLFLHSTAGPGPKIRRGPSKKAENAGPGPKIRRGPALNPKNTVR